MGLPEKANGRVEPELVLLDRPAERGARVVIVVDRRRVLNSERLQRRIEIVALRPRPGAAREQFALERVATGFRNDVQINAALLRFAETAGQVHLHFLCVRGVHDVARHAAAVEGRADVQAVERHVALVAAAAMTREDPHRRRQRDIEASAGD